jgi:hypothetical protein
LLIEETRRAMAFRPKFGVTTVVAAVVVLMAKSVAGQGADAATQTTAIPGDRSDTTRHGVRLLSSFTYLYIPPVDSGRGSLNRELRRTVDAWIGEHHRNQYPGNPLPFGWTLIASGPSESQSDTLIATATRDPSRRSHAIVEFTSGSGEPIAVLRGAVSASSGLLDVNVKRELIEVAAETSQSEVVSESSDIRKRVMTLRWATDVVASFPMLHVRPPTEGDKYGLTARIVATLKERGQWTIVDAFSDGAWKRGDLLQCALGYSGGYGASAWLHCTAASGFVAHILGGSCRTCFGSLSSFSERANSIAAANDVVKQFQEHRERVEQLYSPQLSRRP